MPPPLDNLERARIEPWRFEPPPAFADEEPAARAIGLELEFAGLTPRDAAAAARAALGGDLRQSGPLSAEITGSAIGDVDFELDMALTKLLRRDGGYDSAAAKIEDLLAEGVGEIARLIVPVEMVAPPLPLRRLTEIRPAFDALRKAGALGTGDATLYAFGMHLNIEAPSDAAEIVWRILSAYVLSEDWALRAERPDWSRKLSPFITRYPTMFRIDVLETETVADWPALVEAYLRRNPTRNRALDMLPLLAHHEHGRTEALLGEAVKSPRPAFHYRLPDSRINEPDWSPALSWEIWRRIERAAADADRLSALREAMAARMDWMLDDEEHVAEIDRILS